MPEPGDKTSRKQRPISKHRDGKEVGVHALGEWAVTKYLEFKGFILFDVWHPVIMAFRIYLFERQKPQDCDIVQSTPQIFP